MSFTNRTAVITGATGVLGKAVARHVAGRGANLVLLGTDASRLALLEADLGLPAERVGSWAVDLLDLSSTRAVAEAAAARFGNIAMMLHLVGGYTGGTTLADVPPEDLTAMLNQHVWTSFHAVQAFVPHLLKAGWGRIVMVTSPSASRPKARGGPYAIAKAGQQALMLALARELAGTGVTANLIEVHTIDAERTKVSAPSAANAAWTTPEEISALLDYVFSPEADTLNGAIIPLHGML